MISWQSLQSNFSIQPFHPATKFPFDFHSSYLDRKKEIKRRKRKNDRVPTVSGYLCKIIAHLEPLAAIVSVWSWSRRRVQTRDMPSSEKTSLTCDNPTRVYYGQDALPFYSHTRRQLLRIRCIAYTIAVWVVFYCRF